MDVTLRVVVAASVAIVIAAIALFIVSDSSGMFGRSTGNQIDKADCDFLRGQWEKEKAFGSDKAASNVKSQASSAGCDWTSDTDGGSDSGPDSRPTEPPRLPVPT